MNTLKQSLRVILTQNGLRVWIVSSRVGLGMEPTSSGVGFVKNSGGCEQVRFHLSFIEFRSSLTRLMHLFGCLHA